MMASTPRCADRLRSQAVLQAFHDRKAVGWPDGVDPPVIDPAECSDHIGLTSWAWSKICNFGIMFYDLTEGLRYDPSVRIARRARFGTARERIDAGEPAEAVGLPSVGVPEPVARGCRRSCSFLLHSSRHRNPTYPGSRREGVKELIQNNKFQIPNKYKTRHAKHLPFSNLEFEIFNPILSQALSPDPASQGESNKELTDPTPLTPYETEQVARIAAWKARSSAC